MKRGIVIGGGLSGLVSASILASRGYDITLLERSSHLGGKLKKIELDGYQFELGPSMITIPWIFEKAFHAAGKRLDPNLRFIPLSVNSRNFFADGTILDLTSNADYLGEQLTAFSPEDRAGFIEYIQDVQQIYEMVEEYYFDHPVIEWSDMITWRRWKSYFSSHPFLSMHDFHCRYFDDPRLLAMMNRYATYVGSSPYEAPAYLSFYAYLELIQGVYYVEGGTYRLIESFTNLAKDVGVKIHTSTPVEQILVKENEEIIGVRTDQDTIEADFIISTVDQKTVKNQLLRNAKSRVWHQPPSLSGFLSLLGTRLHFPQLHHHNFFFPSDYGREFVDIFEQEEWSLSPSFYVCYSGYSESDWANHGSNLYVLVNVPATGEDQNPDKLQEQYLRYRDMVLYWLEHDWGFHGLTDHLEQTQFLGPRDFAHISGSLEGSLYGTASHGVRTFFQSMKDRKVKELYYTGGTTHFGGAIVMSVLSGLRIAEAIDKKNGSRNQF